MKVYPGLDALPGWCAGSARQSALSSDPKRKSSSRVQSRAVPPIYSPKDWSSLTAGRTLHELGPVSNICADWELLLSQGLLGRRKVAETTRARMAEDSCAVEFLDSAIETIDAVLGLAARYAKQAGLLGRQDLAAMLESVPAHPARTFREALQSLRLCQAVVWLGGNYHVGLGRFDQYMWPFLQVRPGGGPSYDPGCGRIAGGIFYRVEQRQRFIPGRPAGGQWPDSDPGRSQA